MRCDLVIAGVGGQGVLSVAMIVAEAARREGLTVKQTEVHGMAQRGGAVHATLRISSEPIASELIPAGSADLVLGMEPIEALRHLDLLAAGGALITAADPMEGIAGYPPIDQIHDQVRSFGGRLVDARAIAREAGSPRSANVVMIGAASTVLPLPAATIETCVQDAFAAKGERIAAANLRAFRAGALAAVPG